MAGTVPKITQGSLVIQHALEERPIYFATVGGVKVVIKGDAAGSAGHDRTDDETAISIKWSAKLMKGVNNKLVNTKIMEPAEVAIFLDVARAKFAANSKPGMNVQAVGGPRYTWVKMPHVDGISDADFLEKLNGSNFSTVNKDKLRAAIIKLHDETIWPQLGKVLAVDIFNGNNDRFDVTDGTWINYGNFMFQDLNGQTSVVGLDTFNPMQKESNLAKHGRFDALKTLTDPLAQLQFAKNCTASVGKVLARELFGKDGADRKSLLMPGPDGDVVFTFTKKELQDLYVQYAPALAAGIAKGAFQLKQTLQDKVQLYRARARPLPLPPVIPQAAFGLPLPPPPVIPQGHQHGGPPLRPVLPPPPVRAGHAPPPRPASPPPMRARAGGGLPPLPNAASLQPAPIAGFPQGILDRMAFLGWMP